MQRHPFPPANAIACNEPVPGATCLKTNCEVWTFGVKDFDCYKGEFCRFWFGKESPIRLVKAKVLLSRNENDGILRLWKHKRKNWNLLSGNESHLGYFCSLNAVFTYRIISHSFLRQTMQSEKQMEILLVFLLQTVKQRYLNYWCSKLMNLFII